MGIAAIHMPNADPKQNIQLVSQRAEPATSGIGMTAENCADSRLFVMCENCYWSASLLQPGRTSGTPQGIDLSSCPSCKNTQSLSTIPIADNEVFEFSYSERHGVELDFMPRR